MTIDMPITLAGTRHHRGPLVERNSANVRTVQFLWNRAGAQKPVRPRPELRRLVGLLDAVIAAMKKTAKLPADFTVPQLPPKPAGMTVERYLHILEDCGAID